MKWTSTILGCTLLLATLAIGARSASAQTTGPLTTPNPATAPQMNPQGHAAAPGANGNTPISPRPQAMPPTVNAGQPAVQAADSRHLFTQLDRAHRGYLGKSDVTSNQYLSRHFAECDSDGNGRLSSAEVDACMPHETPQSN